MIGKQLTFV